MLEDEVDNPQRKREDHSGDHHEKGRTLQLLPGRPSGLLGELYEALFQIVNKLSHLYC